MSSLTKFDRQTESERNNELILSFDEERSLNYRGEVYRVRDNGAVIREPKYSNRVRKLDNRWTFGRANRSTGYMNFCGETVHRLVAFAFLGGPPGSGYVVDHIDTNRRNNRVDNLRWMTRLDNILQNPITLRRIEIAYGSLEAFFQNPANPLNQKLPRNFEWMRAVSEAEAKASRDKIQRWAASEVNARGGALGEWVFAYSSEPEIETTLDSDSLTLGARQRNWRTVSEFPTCPAVRSLNFYEEQLTKGATFSKNRFGTSVVVVAEKGDSGLVVLTRFIGDSIKDYAIARVTLEGACFIHESIATFFTLKGAARVYCDLLGVPWKEHCERSRLPWGESIDDFC